MKRNIATLVATCMVLCQNTIALDSKAISQLEAKAQQGDAESAFRLSVHLAMNADSKQASTKWLRLASDLGHPIAQYNLALDLMNDPASEAEGIMLLQISAHAGYRLSSAKLADMHKKLADPNDIKTQLLERKATAGDAVAAFELFKVYSQVRGGESAASKWLRQAADGGNVEALYALGVQWRDRPSFANNEYAKFYFEKAAAKGYGPAQEALHQLQSAKSTDK